MRHHMIWWIALAACGRIDFAERFDARASDSITNADATVTAGLVGWWKLNDATGTTAADSSGNGNPGTLSASYGWASVARGDVLRAPDVAANESVDLGDPALFHLTGSMTLSGWANLSSINVGAADDVLISRNDIDSGQLGWSLKASEDIGPERFAVQIATSAAVAVQRSSVTSPALNIWYHVAAVYDAAAQTLDIYVNGLLDNDVVDGPVPSAQYAPVSAVHTQIGNANPYIPNMLGGQAMFHGMLSDIRIYDRALSASEIMQIATP